MKKILIMVIALMSFSMILSADSLKSRVVKQDIMKKVDVKTLSLVVVSQSEKLFTGIKIGDGLTCAFINAFVGSGNVFTFKQTKLQMMEFT